MKTLSESTEPENSILTVIENYNADVHMAVSDGISMDEMIALAGAITQATLRNIPQDMRRQAWDIMIRIMNKRFEVGEL